MPQQNFYTFIGASVFGVVVAATMYFVEHLIHQRKQHGISQDLARINSEIAILRTNIEKLQKKKSLGSKKKRFSTPISDIESTDRDSSDLEFFDLTDDDDDDDNNVDKNLKTNLQKIDAQIDNNINTLNDIIEQLKTLLKENPCNTDILWRLGRCYYKLADNIKDKNDKLEQINVGIEYCQESIKLNNLCGYSHKWLATLVGLRTNCQPLNKKMGDSILFKEHCELALKLKPDDPYLYYMYGRFLYEISQLTWLERKTASYFMEIPNATVENALDYFLKCENLLKESFKENKIMVAKCKIIMNHIDDALEWLEKAKTLAIGQNAQLDEECNYLLEKYTKKC